jgi:hypothetical protein
VVYKEVYKYILCVPCTRSPASVADVIITAAELETGERSMILVKGPVSSKAAHPSH